MADVENSTQDRDDRRDEPTGTPTGTPTTPERRTGVANPRRVRR